GLATNVFFPGPLYHGVLAGADLAGMLVAVAASGFRLSVRLALLGGAASLVGALLLVAAGFTICTVAVPYAWPTTLVAMPLGAFAPPFAVALAWRTRALVFQGARASERLERVRHGFEMLLHTHHDAQAVLSSATLNADLLLRDMGAGAGGGDGGDA